jgi:hypothetical protein
MPDARKIDRFYYGRVLRWLLIGCLYLVSVGLFIWAFIDESVDTLGTEDVIRGYRWHGLFFFALAIGLFVGVEWIVRFPLPLRRHRIFMKLIPAFCLVGMGLFIGYSFGFYGGVLYINNSRIEYERMQRLLKDAARKYSSEHSNHVAIVTDASTNQAIPKP